MSNIRLTIQADFTTFAGSMQLTEDIMYEALVQRDATFEGVFFAGIRTTGIFCRPTCRARKPLRKNVEFFASAPEAIAGGYRPCKICTPLEPAGTAPPAIRKLLTEMADNPGKKLYDRDLRDRGLDPNTVRRWFRQTHGTTFHGFQRMTRMHKSLELLREGSDALDAALESGYASRSGFTDAFRSVFNKSPQKDPSGNVLVVARIPSPLGTLIAGATEKGLCLLEFSERRMLETEFKQLRSIFNSTVVYGENKHLLQTAEELEAYFAGVRKHFDVQLQHPGTEFQLKVWNRLLKIPYGNTISYGEQAKSMGAEKAVRAVAHANGMNRIAILIPCHRVIGENGKLTGYGGGIWRKKWLLEHERNHSGFPSQGNLFPEKE